MLGLKIIDERGAARKRDVHAFDAASIKAYEVTRSLNSTLFELELAKMRTKLSTESLEATQQGFLLWSTDRNPNYDP